MLSFLRTTVALSNTMIGSAILILPLMFLHNGILASLLIVGVGGILNYYSSLICIDHLADGEDHLGVTLDRHLRKEDGCMVYDICLYVGAELVFNLYYNIILRQWTGLFYKHTTVTHYMPLLTLASLIILTLSLRGFRLAITFMAFGITSIVAYLLFVLWMFWTRHSPQLNEFPLIKAESIPDLLGLMGTAWAIQGVFI